MSNAPRATEELIEKATTAHQSAIKSGHLPTIQLTAAVLSGLVTYDDSVEHAVTVLRRTLDAPSARKQLAAFDERRSWERARDTAGGGTVNARRVG